MTKASERMKKVYVSLFSFVRCTSKRMVFVTLLSFALLLPEAVVRADSVTVDFSVNFLRNDDTYHSAYFFLLNGQPPNQVSLVDNGPCCTPLFQFVEYDDVPLEFIDTASDGSILSESSGIGTVRFWFDSIVVLPTPLSPAAISFTGVTTPFNPVYPNPYNPQFIPGTYISNTWIGSYYTVAYQTRTLQPPTPGYWRRRCVLFFEEALLS
jgi:hypothetical protein